MFDEELAKEMGIADAGSSTTTVPAAGFSFAEHDKQHPDAGGVKVNKPHISDEEAGAKKDVTERPDRFEQP